MSIYRRLIILEYEIAKDVFNLLKQLNRYGSVENKFIYIFNQALLQ